MGLDDTNATTILVIDDEPEAAQTVVDMIEFLDAPLTTCAKTDNWRDIAANSCLAGVFIGAGMSASKADQIAADVQQSHPDVPVVLISRGGSDD
ncbi:MAG: hypothetical protein AAGA84_12500 [Pseudomonadota bacterium]